MNDHYYQPLKLLSQATRSNRDAISSVRPAAAAATMCADVWRAFTATFDNSGNKALRRAGDHSLSTHPSLRAAIMRALARQILSPIGNWSEGGATPDSTLLTRRRYARTTPAKTINYTTSFSFLLPQRRVVAHTQSNISAISERKKLRVQLMLTPSEILRQSSLCHFAQ